MPSIKKASAKIKKVVSKLVKATKPASTTIRYSANDRAWAIVDPKNVGAIVELLPREGHLFLEKPVFTSQEISEKYDSCGSTSTRHRKAGVATGTLHRSMPKALKKTTDFVNFRFTDAGTFLKPDGSVLTEAKWLAMGGDRFATVKL